MLTPVNNDIEVPSQKPKDVVKLINHLIAQFQNENYKQTLFDMIKKAAREETNTKEEEQIYISELINAQRKCYTALLSNNYTYLTADVCDMVAETQETLKEWTVQDLLIEPNTSGVVLFEKPKFTKETKITTDAEPGTVTQHTYAMGICWIYFTDQTIGKKPDAHQGDVLWASLIAGVPRQHSTMELNYGLGGNEFAYQVLKDGTLDPLTEESPGNSYDQAIMDYLAATMMLMQQREIIAEPSVYEPTVKRGKRRDPVRIPTANNTLEPMKISTVSLSETVRAAYAANTTNTGTGQKPTKSWWVKGHWRHQPHGPGKTLRKLIYIHPHISGNINAPLDGRKTITKVTP